MPSGTWAAGSGIPTCPPSSCCERCRAGLSGGIDVERSRERENEILTFARDELERRRRAPVFVDGARVRAGLAAENQQGMIHLIDPRMGFSVRSIRLWVNLFGFDEGHMG